MLCCSLSYNAAVVVVYMFSQSVAKPADWKYQSGLCSSWATVSCSLNVDMLLPLPNNRTSTGNMEECLKVGTHTCAWDLFFLHGNSSDLVFCFRKDWKRGHTRLRADCVWLMEKGYPRTRSSQWDRLFMILEWMNKCLIAGLGSIICTLLCANQFQHRLLWLDDK